MLVLVYVDNLEVASNNLEGPSCGHNVLHLAITGAMFEHSQLRELSDSPTRFLCIKGDGLVGRTYSTLAPGTPANNAVLCTAFKLPLGIDARRSEDLHKSSKRPLWFCSETNTAFAEIDTAAHVFTLLPQVLMAGPTIRDPFHPELTESEALNGTLEDAQRRLLHSAVSCFDALTGISGLRGHP